MSGFLARLAERAQAADAPRVAPRATSRYERSLAPDRSRDDALPSPVEPAARAERVREPRAASTESPGKPPPVSTPPSPPSHPTPPRLDPTPPPAREKIVRLESPDKHVADPGPKRPAREEPHAGSDDRRGRAPAPTTSVVAGRPPYPRRHDDAESSAPARANPRPTRDAVSPAAALRSKPAAPPLAPQPRVPPRPAIAPERVSAAKRPAEPAAPPPPAEPPVVQISIGSIEVRAVMPVSPPAPAPAPRPAASKPNVPSLGDYLAGRGAKGGAR